MRFIVLVTLAALAFVATSAPEHPPTLKQCAMLLPKGTYTFSFVGAIDNTGNEPHLSGELNVSDNTTVNKQQEGAAFAQCLARALR